MIKLKIEEYNKLVDLIAEHLYVISQTFMCGIDSRVSKEEILNAFKTKEFEKEWKDIKQELETSEIWKDGKHFGDCTDFPGPCLRCEYESYIEESREKLKNIGIV
jgi:hypothetical protein